MDDLITDFAHELRKKMDAANLADLKAMKREELLRLHFSLGQYVRNKFIYGNDELEKQLQANDELSFWGYDPDEISRSIIERLWELLQDEE